MDNQGLIRNIERLLRGMHGNASQKATGAAAVAMSVAPGVQWQLKEVRIHLSAVGGAECGSLTITINSGTNAVYDCVLATQDMAALADYPYLPARPIILAADDVVDIAWANVNAVTYGIEAIYAPLY